jgi:hypothetical protein
MYRSLLLVLALAGTAAAQPAPTTSAPLGVYNTAPAKHSGLFLRATPGIAASAAVASVDNEDLSISGGAGRFGIAAGWAIQPRLILLGELIGHATLGPELEYKGNVTMTDDDVTWGISYAGAGVNYYLPSNLYLTGTAGALVMSLETSDGVMNSTNTGFGLKLGVGKEWFVAPKVGLGVGVELLAGSVPDGDANWGVATLGLTFSATYN